MRTYLVVGASRGIGLGIVAELVSPDSRMSTPTYHNSLHAIQLKDTTAYVLATARVPARSTGLQELVAAYPSRVAILECDATDATSVERAASAAAALLPDGQGLDCLIHNAAISVAPLVTFEDMYVAQYSSS